MPEIVSTVSTFNLPVDELIQEAYDHLGGEYTSGYDAISARRSLNLLLQDMMTRGYPLIQTENRSLTLVASTNQYSLGEDVLSIIDANFVNEDGLEIPLKAQSIFDYFSMADKDQEGTSVSQYAFDRSSSTPKLFLHPTPSVATTINYWCVKKPKSVTASYQLVDVAARYLPAMVFGLAFFLGMKKPMFPMDRLQKLEDLYASHLERAFDEDREKGDIQLYPSLGGF